jgi:hypothetical protein
MLDDVLRMLIVGQIQSPHVQAGGARLEVGHAAVGSGLTLSICRTNHGPDAKEMAIYRASLRRLGWALGEPGLPVSIAHGQMNDWIGTQWRLVEVKVKPASDPDAVVQPGLFGDV